MSNPRQAFRWSLPALVLAAAAGTVPAGGAQAALSVAYGNTVNVICSAGVCHATAANAVLGVQRLQRLLASGNVTLEAGSLANDITVEAPVSWVSANGLTLDARHSIRIDRTIDVAGPGSLALTTNDGTTGGTLSFGAKGNVHFWSTSNSLTINAEAFTLVDSIAALASAVTAQPSGNYALAASYDATPDGVYTAAAVAPNFTGTFDGLGNTISHFTLHSTARDFLGLFRLIDVGGAVENLVMKAVEIRAIEWSIVGAVAADNFGRIENVTAVVNLSAGHTSDVGGLVGIAANGSLMLSSQTAGVVRGAYNTEVGGLVGDTTGGDVQNIIANSHSTAKVAAGNDSHAGGLVGILSGYLTKSWASGPVSVTHANGGAPVASAGGLVGYLFSATGQTTALITNCYASGPVAAGPAAAAGGLIGVTFTADSNHAPIAASYSFGTVSAAAGGYTGGLIGYRDSQATTVNTYWDMTASGISDPTKGVGNKTSDPGVTGLTTAQLQSGLPAGFSAAVWAENHAFLNGRPFLIANLPD